MRRRLQTFCVVLCSILWVSGRAAAAPPADTGGRSAFAAWWTPLVMQGVPEQIRQRCAHQAAVTSTPCAAPPNLAAWCSCYSGHAAQSFDLPALLESPPLAMAAFLGARSDLLAPLQSLTRLGAGQDGANLTNLNVLMHASLESLDNSGGISALLPAPVAALNLGSLAERWLEGAYQALQAQAEAEAVAVALEQGLRALCSTPDLRDNWFATTCSAARAGAFAGIAPEAGAASFVFLQHTLREDVRGFVAPLAARLVALQPAYAAAAPGVRAVLTALLQGEAPASALAQLAEALAAVPTPLSTPLSTPTVQALRCLSSVPVALPRWQAWVGAAERGLAPQLDAGQRQLVTFLLASLQPACSGIVARSDGARLGLWLKLQDALLASTAGLQAATPGPLQDVQAWQAAVAQVLTQADAAAQSVAVLMRAAAPASSEGTAFYDGAPPMAAGVREAIPDLAQALPTVRAFVLLATQAAAGDAAAVYRGVLRLAMQHPNSFTLPPEVVKYGGFVLAMLTAEQPETIKATLLGAGSTGWRTKYQKRGHLVLSFAGMLGLGAHWTAGQDTRPQLLAGLGIDAVYVVCPGFNAGLFLQVLDLGGYTSYAAEGASKPRVLQALSPGILARAGILGMPLLITGGAMYDVDAGGPQALGAWRAALGLAIDATFWVF